MFLETPAATVLGSSRGTVGAATSSATQTRAAKTGNCVIYASGPNGRPRERIFIAERSFIVTSSFGRVTVKNAKTDL